MAPLYIIGTGPGALTHLTTAAQQALAESTVIIGFSSYIELIRPLLTGKATADGQRDRFNRHDAGGGALPRSHPQGAGR